MFNWTIILFKDKAQPLINYLHCVLYSVGWIGVNVRLISFERCFGKWLPLHYVRLNAEELQQTKQVNLNISGGVISQPMDGPSASQHMLSHCLAVPHQDLLRTRAQWGPRLWAPCWTLCCSYSSAWCCCHCRRILCGKAGRETCAKTRQQATLHGWTHIIISSRYF